MIEPTKKQSVHNRSDRAKKGVDPMDNRQIETNDVMANNLISHFDVLDSSNDR